jgi:hypothetical protein
MTEHEAFLLKDLVLLAASFYLLKQDVRRVASRQQPGKDVGSQGTGKRVA